MLESDSKRRITRSDLAASGSRTWRAASAIDAQSFGTGGGDIFEVEPNDTLAQAVSLPVNVFGKIGFDADADFFAFRALAGQQITVEAFAARIPDSVLIPDIAIFDSTGELLQSSAGSRATDPVVRYTPEADQLLIAGIADVEDVGSNDADYVLNVTRGVDVTEGEPNDTRAQVLSQLPATIFGEITSNDVDYFSFTADAGQTLIVDVDAEVLGSRLDSEINLIEPETELQYVYNDQNDGDDSRYNIVLPYTGRYAIGVGAFANGRRGFYRLNISLVSSDGAPVLTGVTREGKKKALITGAGFTEGSAIEINGKVVRTTTLDGGTLRAKGKIRVGNVVTVTNPPDGRRSNPLIVQ
jgi:hypothetical protein